MNIFNSGKPIELERRVKTHNCHAQTANPFFKEKTPSLHRFLINNAGEMKS